MMSNIIGDFVEAKAFDSYRNPKLAVGVGNTGFIKGVITEEGVPAQRRVVCYHRKSGYRVSTTWSDSNGDYSFPYLIAGVTYYITALDENNDDVQYNAVTNDIIIASSY